MPNDKKLFLAMISHTLSLNLGAIHNNIIITINERTRADIKLDTTLHTLAELSTWTALYLISPPTEASLIWASLVEE